MAESLLVASAESLRREAEVFTRYLVARSPSDYVAAKYRDGHRVIPYRRLTGTLPIDELLVRVARRGVALAWLADTYGRIFRHDGPLRQKLVLLTAILESSPSFHENMTGSRSTSRVRVYLTLLGMGLGFVVRLAVAMLVFGPVQLVGALTGPKPRAESERPDG
ncbi:MAG: hypothetical protein HKM89_01310 [Gemmatimonadales bacterium]|nr:hypothetical protein [Gemmatimonadales bacterium]